MKPGLHHRIALTTSLTRYASSILIYLRRIGSPIICYRRPSQYGRPTSHFIIAISRQCGDNYPLRSDDIAGRDVGSQSFASHSADAAWRRQYGDVLHIVLGLILAALPLTATARRLASSRSSLIGLCIMPSQHIAVHCLGR